MTRVLPATVIMLGLVSLLTDLSSEMIYFLLPLYLSTVLGAGAVGLAALPASVLFGYLLQAHGPAPAFLTGAGLALAVAGLLLRVPPRAGAGQAAGGTGRS